MVEPKAFFYLQRFEIKGNKIRQIDSHKEMISNKMNVQLNQTTFVRSPIIPDIDHFQRP